VKRLIELGVDVDATDLNGQTPLMQAIISAPVDTSANFEVEELLLQAGADCTKTDSRGRTVTHFAFLKSTDALPEAFALLEEADGKTAFTTAGWKYLGSGNAIDPVETISSLTASRFKAPVDVADKDGLTPLHLACWRGCEVQQLSLFAIAKLVIEGINPLIANSVLFVLWRHAERPCAQRS
jgi:ankyrin repeat protein